MLSIKQFTDIPYDEVFATGLVKDSPEGINMTNTGNELRWIAKKGQGDDWAIYCYWSNRSIDYIKKFGEKVLDNGNILKLVPCEDSVLQLYRK